MPYKSEKIRLPEALDRRRRLSDADKAEIARRYKAEGCSLQSLATEYGCSKKSVLLIVNPESKARNDQRIREHWRDYVPGKDERNKIAREHRAYKHGLMVQGLLEEEHV
jgi:hypothetical protein